ncbi:MAG: CARDB domain-containing protein [Thermoplasmataceae archaeon]
MTMIGSAFLAAGTAGASSPQTGSLSFNVVYVGGGTQAPANSSTNVMLETPSGQVLLSATGSSVTFPSLYYGNYTVVVPAQYLTDSALNGRFVVVNQTFHNVSLNSKSSLSTMELNVSVEPTHKVFVSVQNLSSGSASLSFKSLQGFVFNSASVSAAANSTNLSLPSKFFAIISYQSASYTYLETNVGNTLKLNVYNGTAVSGFVSASNGAKISTVYVTIINGTDHNYTTTQFTGNSFVVYSPNWDNEFLIVSSPGYNSTQYQGKNLVGGKYLSSVVLQPASSSIYYNYSLSENLQTLNLNITYSIGNNTAIPQLANSSVGSLYWQWNIDSLSTAYVDGYINSTVVNYTANSFLVNGVYYNLTGRTTFKPTSVTPKGITATVQATYQNMTSISASVYNSAFPIKFYALGTQYSPGTLGYQYNISYKNTSIALNSSSSSSVKLSGTPILIPAQPSSGFVTLTLVPVKSATITNSLVQFKINGKIVNNLLNSTQSNTIFTVPYNVPVNMNVSKAFYNPVTGTNDYQNSIFNWAINSKANSHPDQSNVTTPFNKGLNVVYVNFTSGSGVKGNTSFFVYGFDGTPTVVYNITSNGKTISNNTASTSPIHIYVNQTQTVQFSAYYSMLKISNSSLVGSPYNVPLKYNWTFPTAVSLSANSSYVFKKPSISVGPQTMYINVSSVSGNASAKFTVTVNDTTPPVAVVTIMNAKGQVISQPVAGQNITLTASSSYDPYYNSTYLSANKHLTLNYSWKIESTSGVPMSPSSSTYTILAGTNYSKTFNVEFETVSSVNIVLTVRNPANVSGTSNSSYAMIVNSPRIVVNSIYLPSTPQQGISSTIWVNVTNAGTVMATNFTLTITVGGSQVAAKTFTDANLSAGSSTNVSLTWKPGSSGSLGITVVGSATGEPSFMQSIGEYSSTISIKTSPYTTPIIIGAVIAVIVVVGFVYYRLSSSRGSRSTAIKKRDESKKLPEKKK